MPVRTIRWVPAGLLAAVALFAAPAQSRADTQYLIQETDQNGATINGTTQIFTTASGAPDIQFSTPNFNGTVGATPSSGQISSLTTTVRATPATNFDATHQLRVVVVDDSLVQPYSGGNGTISNNASASAAIGGGQNSLTNETQLFVFPANPAINNPPVQQAVNPGGTPIGAKTDPATDIRPGGGVSPTTSTDVTGLPGKFSIQQTITVKVITSGTIATGSTLGGSASSFVLSSPPAQTPAPAGLILALTGLPLIGLYRAVRRRAKTPTAG